MSSAVRIAFVLAVVLLAGCGATGSGDSSSNQSALVATDAIIARAEDYVTRNIVYCGGPLGGWDMMGCTNGVCRPPRGPWETYRSDCSGFVSYAWQMASDPDSSTYSYDRGGANGWTT